MNINYPEIISDEDEELCELCEGQGEYMEGEFDDEITKECPDCGFNEE